MKLLALPTLAKALAASPPNWLALRLATWVVELTTSGAVPVGTVETSRFPVRFPVALRETPVSAGVPLPDANSRLNFPDGLDVLFPTGSACQRKCWLTAACVLLSKAEASESSGWESNPVLPVAVPVAGNCSLPRMKVLPLTSSLPAGLLLPMPTLPVLSKTADWWRTQAAVNLARKLALAVPSAVIVLQEGLRGPVSAAGRLAEVTGAVWLRALRPVAAAPAAAVTVLAGALA